MERVLYRRACLSKHKLVRVMMWVMGGVPRMLAMRLMLSMRTMVLRCRGHGGPNSKHAPQDDPDHNSPPLLYAAHVFYRPFETRQA